MLLSRKCQGWHSECKTRESRDVWRRHCDQEYATDGGDALVATNAKKAKIDVESARQESRITCGSDTIL